MSDGGPPPPSSGYGRLNGRGVFYWHPDMRCRLALRQHTACKAETWEKRDIMDPQFAELVMNAFSVARGGAAKNIANVYQFYRTNGIGPRVKANVESAFQAAIGDVALLALNVDYTQTGTSVRWMDDATDAPVSFAEAGVGAIANDRSPDHVCATVQLHSGRRGWASRGSKHFGPISEDDTLGDVLDAGAIVRFQALADAILAGFTDTDGNQWLPIIVSRAVLSHPVFSTNPTFWVWAQVTNVIVNHSLGSMRRRKIRTVT